MTTTQPLTLEESKWLQLLKDVDYDQGHLFENVSPQKTKEILSQLSYVDESYPGGLLNYLKRARKLLSDSQKTVNPFDGCIPEVPLSVFLSCGTSEYLAYEKEGLEELDGLAFVLVAGGLGERLGYPGIKLSLPVESLTGITYLEYYIEMIFACQNLVEKTQNRKVKLPFCIMTSDETHVATIKLLEDNNYFKFPRDQITLIKQQRVPALLDNEAHISVKYNSLIEMKPHGHGDVHSLLHSNNLPNKWLSEGIRWVIFFQDTNALVCNALLSLLGVSKKMKLTMNTLTIPRKPGEALGAICKLNSQDKPPLTINVEYNVLGSLLKNGDVAEENGYSKFPGNTNILILNLKNYTSVLEKTGGCVPEFVNPKYTNASKTTFKSPTRLECMMQDLPRYFSDAQTVGITQLDRWLCFSTVKNDIKTAITRIESNLAPECALCGEADFYYANTKLLEIAAKRTCQKVEIASPEPICFSGVIYKMGPRVVMLPSFGIGLNQISNRIKGGYLYITAKSGLVLDGNISISGLKLSGGLKIKAKQKQHLNIKNLTINNEGFVFSKLDEKDLQPHLSIRGYKVKSVDVAEIEI